MNIYLFKFISPEIVLYTADILIIFCRTQIFIHPVGAVPTTFLLLFSRDQR